jgi:hypothetical protein
MIGNVRLRDNLSRSVDLDQCYCIFSIVSQDVYGDIPNLIKNQVNSKSELMPTTWFLLV